MRNYKEFVDFVAGGMRRRSGVPRTES